MALQLMRLRAIAQNSNLANLVDLEFYGIVVPPDPSMFLILVNQFLYQMILWNRSIYSEAVVFSDFLLPVIDRMVIVIPNIFALISMVAPVMLRHFRPIELIVLQRFAVVLRFGCHISTGIPVNSYQMIH